MILDDEDVLISDIKNTTHRLNVLQTFIKIDNDGCKYIDECDFDNIHKLLNQIWDVSCYTLFEWKVSNYGVFRLNYIDPEHADHPAEICKIEFFNYKKFNEIQTVVKMSSPDDLTFYGYLYEQCEELYDLVKYFQNQLIEKLKLRKKGGNLYII